MPDDFATSPTYVVVHKHPKPPGGNLMYVILENRPAFDLIDLPMTDHGPKPHGHVITKNIDRGNLYIVFQFWIEKPKP
jgi:hypothetical protein